MISASCEYEKWEAVESCGETIIWDGLTHVAQVFGKDSTQTARRICSDLRALDVALRKITELEAELEARKDNGR